MERPVSPLVDTRTGPRVPAGRDVEVTMETDAEDTGDGPGESVPVGCSHEQAFRRDGEQLHVEGL